MTGNIEIWERRPLWAPFHLAPSVGEDCIASNNRETVEALVIAIGKIAKCQQLAGCRLSISPDERQHQPP
jgi:hypothetical protein